MSLSLKTGLTSDIQILQLVELCNCYAFAEASLLKNPPIEPSRIPQSTDKTGEQLGTNQEVAVGEDAPEGGEEVGDGLHDVPRELPECQTQEQAPLHHQEHQARPQHPIRPPAFTRKELRQSSFPD